MLLGSVSRVWFIYALVDPRYSEPNRRYRYIGWSYNAEWRYECHLWEAHVKPRASLHGDTDAYHQTPFKKVGSGSSAEELRDWMHGWEQHYD